jgi:N-acetylglucosamine-6-phosphate deacetylase
MNTLKSPNRILTKALFDGAKHHYDKVLSVSKGVIVAVDNDISNHDVVLDGLLVPGYVDLQVNGGGGLLFNANPCIDSLKKMMQAHSQFGTTAMLPTIITDNLKTMVRAADIISYAIKDNMLGILGIHFEGPHISITKKGAHSQEFIRPISEEEWKIFERKDIGYVLVTLAPEVVPIEDIKRLVSMGVHVCIGHSNATYEITNRAIEAGATGFTHLYNAMSAITGREAGVTGSALLNDHTQCGLIVDGHHVSVASCKLALKVKPVGGIFLVTDAMPPVGTQSTEFDFFDRIVTCHKGKLTSSTGELAGSTLDMATAVKNCHKLLNVSLPEAVRMASLYPLKFLQKANLPIEPSALIAINKDASFVQLNQELNVVSTWIKGQCVFGSH